MAHAYFRFGLSTQTNDFEAGPAEFALTQSQGVTKMWPKMVLYMLNMLHMWR